jgi:Fur family ferric uptake transcriptional regulator
MSQLHANLINQTKTTFQRYTSQRRKLLNVLLCRETPFSAEEVRKTIPTIGRATLYRTLAQLVTDGLFCRVVLENGKLVYQSAPQEHHHHLVCFHCTNIFDITSCQISGFAAKIANSRGFSKVTHRFKMYGLCASCNTLGEILPLLPRSGGS